MDLEVAPMRISRSLTVGGSSDASGDKNDISSVPFLHYLPYSLFTWLTVPLLSFWRHLAIRINHKVYQSQSNSRSN
jgi:hypothetical protein